MCISKGWVLKGRDETKGYEEGKVGRIALAAGLHTRLKLIHNIEENDIKKL